MEKRRNQRMVIKCNDQEKAKYMLLSDNLSRLVRQLLNEEIEIHKTLEDLIKNEPTN